MYVPLLCFMATMVFSAVMLSCLAGCLALDSTGMLSLSNQKIFICWIESQSLVGICLHYHHLYKMIRPALVREISNSPHWCLHDNWPSKSDLWQSSIINIDVSGQTWESRQGLCIWGWLLLADAGNEGDDTWPSLAKTTTYLLSIYLSACAIPSKHIPHMRILHLNTLSLILHYCLSNPACLLEHTLLSW